MCGQIENKFYFHRFLDRKDFCRKKEKLLGVIDSIFIINGEKKILFELKHSYIGTYEKNISHKCGQSF
jgi:hypothetical protein